VSCNTLCGSAPLIGVVSARTSEVKRILKFRNKLAHGKTETVEGSWSANMDETPISQIETEWQKMCTPKKAKKILDDVTKIVTELHKKAGMGDLPFLSTGHARFSGR
jgi:hypothetical protein